MSAPICRRNSSFAISAFTAAGDASTGPVANHRNRVAPSPASTTSRESSPLRRSSVNSCANRSKVSARATSRACATRSTTVTGPDGSPARKPGTRTPTGTTASAIRAPSPAPARTRPVPSTSAPTPSATPSSAPPTADAPYGSSPTPVRTDRIRINVKLLGQPHHRSPRRRRHIIRHEPQPGQRAQRHRQAKPVRRTTSPPRIHEHRIRRCQGEKPDSSSRPISGNRRSPSNSSSVDTCVAYNAPQPAHRSQARKPTQPYPPDFRRVLRRPPVRRCAGVRGPGHLQAASTRVIGPGSATC